MAMIIKHHDQDGYIEITCSGDIDINEAWSALESIIRLGEETACDLLLADLLDMRHAPDSMELFNIASNYPPNLRTAIVLPRQSNFDHEFFENAARNRGRSISSFASREDALGWLKGPPS